MSVASCYTVLGDYYSKELFRYLKVENDSHASFAKLKYACECGNEGIDCEIMRTIRTMIENRFDDEDIERFLSLDMEVD
jgi:hypothetical protein